MAIAQVTAALRESPTWDEPIHLAAGYAYLRTGDYRLNREHPPLQKLLSALPLLYLQPRLPIDDPSWAKDEQADFGRAFLFKNKVSADAMLFAGRCPTILLTLCLGLAIALWTRRYFGAAPALVATFLFATDPNFIAHGHYVTTDLVSALFYFLTCVAWQAWLQKPNRLRLLATGISMGLALSAKFSMILLLPLLPALYFVRWWQAGRKEGFWRTPRGLAAAVLLALLVACAVYGPAPLQKETRKLRDVVDRSTPAGYVLKVAGKWFHLPAHPFLTGLDLVARHNKTGHESYLLGMTSEKGWWYYFPVVFAVKTPSAVLALCVLVPVLALARGRLKRVQRADFLWAFLILPPLWYFAFSMTSRINIGVRHLLPVYPFLVIVLSAALFRLLNGRKAALAVALLAALQLTETAIASPHFLAFFNLPSGGPANGAKYLVDSNLDWGQELKGLKRYMDANRVSSVCLCYFGNADPSYYGINGADLPATGDTDARSRMDCVAAISATPLYGVYVPKNSFRWLRERTPAATIGHSIYIYDFRKKR